MKRLSVAVILVGVGLFVFSVTRLFRNAQYVHYYGSEISLGTAIGAMLIVGGVIAYWRWPSN